MAIPLYILLDEMGLLDSLLGLSLVYATTAIPFCTWNMKGYFDTIPIELEEAAWMDGADRWTIFWTIVLPLARPALVVTGLFSFMTAWNRIHLGRHLHEQRNIVHAARRPPILCRGLWNGVGPLLPPVRFGQRSCDAPVLCSPKTPGRWTDCRFGKRVKPTN